MGRGKLVVTPCKGPSIVKGVSEPKKDDKPIEKRESKETEKVEGKRFRDGKMKRSKFHIAMRRLYTCSSRSWPSIPH